MREGGGWGEGRLVSDRRQDRRRNDHGLAPESRTDLNREQIRGGGTLKFPTCDTTGQFWGTQELTDESSPDSRSLELEVSEG